MSLRHGPTRRSADVSKASSPRASAVSASPATETRPSSLPENGRTRVIIEGVTPEIDAGRHPIKRCVGERVIVEADIFADGHDVLSALLRFRQTGDSEWSEIPMQPLVNDRWRAQFEVTRLGEAWYS